MHVQYILCEEAPLFFSPLIGEISPNREITNSKFKKVLNDFGGFQ
jgi:hypothetical protein